jgi:hypothetical protein
LGYNRRARRDGENLDHALVPRISGRSSRGQGGDPANVGDELKWFSISEMLLLTNIVDGDYPRFASQRSLLRRSALFRFFFFNGW